MASGPGRSVLGWVAGVLGTGPPEVVSGLRDGASPWLLRAGGREVVLRVGRPAIAHELATEAAALELAAGLGVSVPELLGSDDGRAAGVPVVLSARLPGSSQPPRPRTDGQDINPRDTQETQVTSECLLCAGYGPRSRAALPARGPCGIAVSADP